MRAMEDQRPARGAMSPAMPTRPDSSPLHPQKPQSSARRADCMDRDLLFPGPRTRTHLTQAGPRRLILVVGGARLAGVGGRAEVTLQQALHQPATEECGSVSELHPPHFHLHTWRDR